MKNFYAAVAVRASVDMRSRADLYRAVTPGGDFASNGRSALGVLLSNANSGQPVQVGVFGELPFFAGGVCSFGYALTVSTSGAFAGMSPAALCGPGFRRSLRMSALLGKLYIDPLLSNFAVGFEPRGLIAPQVLPVVDVPRQSGVYAVFEQADLFRIGDTKRAPGTEANRIRFRVGSDTYFCTNYAVKTQVLLEEIANADAVFRMKLEQQRVAGGLTMLAMDWENRLSAKLFNAANVGSSAQVASSWTTSASNPVGDLNTALDNVQNATGYRPNTMVIGVEAWRALRRHPDVINKARNPNVVAGGNYPATEEVARLFELDRILVGAAYKNVAQEGQPQQLKPVWGPHCLVAYMEYQQLIDAPTFSAAFRWVEAGVPNMQVERLPYDSRIKAQELEAGYFQDEKIVAKPLGFLVSSCV